MDKRQADAAANAILELELQKQREHEARLRVKEAKAKTQHRRSRIAAWFALSGAAIGGVGAYFTGQHFPKGIIWGGIMGALVGWAVAYGTVRTVAA